MVYFAQSKEDRGESFLFLCRDLSEVFGGQEWYHRAAQDAVTAAVYLAQDYANNVLNPVDIGQVRQDLLDCDFQLGASYANSLNHKRRGYLVDRKSLNDAQALIELIDARVRDGIKADADVNRVLFPRRYVQFMKLPAPSRAGPSPT